MSTLSTRTPFVAVVGNPNAGKTTLFNALTGSLQKVGNYPGVTVERVSANLNLDGQDVEIVDVPGLYSLEAVSEDEHVALDVLTGKAGRKPDLLVVVVDSTHLERHLYVFSQLAETRLPIVVALTMTDMLAAKGALVDLKALSDVLGVDVVAVVGHKKMGLRDLKDSIARNLQTPRVPPAPDEIQWDELAGRFARAGIDVSSDELARMVREEPDEMAERLQELPDLKEAFLEARGRLEGAKTKVSERFAWAADVQRQVIAVSPAALRKSRTDKIDMILTHRVFGLMVFAAIMYLVFQSIYTFAGPLMELIDSAFASIKGWVSPMLAGNEHLQSLVVDGVIGGVGAAVIFIPQICILFLFIAILEGTGYLARAAFLMDKLLGWCGLNGRAFIPLLSSYACAIPGIMAARVMPDKKSRLATILVAPLMSCSARLPVYVLMIGAFIEPQFGPFWAGFTLFAMHLLGLIVAIPVVWFLNRGVIKGKKLPFLLELPRYQLPKWRDVWISMYVKGKSFLQTAGTIIVLMSIVMWALLYFPRSAEADARYAAEYAQKQGSAVTESGLENYVQARQMEDSYLGRFGRAIEPAFVPAGFDWRLTTAILSAFPAREVVVASMGIIFNLGADQDEGSNDLRKAIQNAKWPDGRPLVTPLTAVGLMVFFALCCQCMATLATVKRETGTWKWPAFMFTYMTVLAYLFAVAIYQIGRALGAS